MNVLIVGSQHVGRKLAVLLEKLGHDVNVLDPDPNNLAPLSTMDPPFSGMLVQGVPIDVDVLRSAGAESCDAVAAVSRDDNVNIMVAQIARDIFHVEKVIARITNPDSKDVYAQRFGLRAVCGTNLTANAVLAGLLEDDAGEQSVVFGSSSVLFTAVPPQPGDVGMLLAEVQLPRADLSAFGVLHKNGVVELACPSLALAEGDKIILAELAD